MAEMQQDLGNSPACRLDRQALVETAHQGAQSFGNSAYEQSLMSARQAADAGLSSEAEIFFKAAEQLKQRMIDEGFADPSAPTLTISFCADERT